MTITATNARESTRSRRKPDAKASGWLHLCNGLDPRRDGGMVQLSWA